MYIHIYIYIYIHPYTHTYMILQYTTLHYTILYYTILYYTILSYTMYIICLYVSLAESSGRRRRNAVVASWSVTCSVLVQCDGNLHRNRTSQCILTCCTTSNWQLTNDSVTRASRRSVQHHIKCGTGEAHIVIAQKSHYHGLRHHGLSASKMGFLCYDYASTFDIFLC